MVSVIFNTTIPPTLENDVFSGTLPDIKSYVPFGTLVANKTAWTGLVDTNKIVELVPVAFKSLNADSINEGETTAKLTLTFDKDITSLNINDITVTGLKKGL